MADLDLALFQGTLPRRQPRSVGGVPSLRGAQFVPGGGEATSVLGGAIAKIGQDLNDIDARFEAAKAATLGTEALTQVIRRMNTRAQEIEANPAIYPTDRAEVLSKEFEASIDDVQQSLPMAAQASFRKEAFNAFLGLQQQLAGRGRKEAVARSKAAYTTRSEQLLDEWIAANNDATRALVTEEFRTETEKYVTMGVLSPEQAELDRQQWEDRGILGSLQLSIRANPEAAFDHLLALSEGKRGNPAMAVPDPSDVPALLDEATQQLSARMSLDAKREQREIDTKTTASRTQRTIQIEQLVLNRNDTAALTQLLAEATDAREAGILLADDAEVVQRFGLALIEAEDTEQRTQTDPAALQEYFRMLGDRPDDAEDYVIEHTGAGIGVGAAPGLLSSARNARDERHYRNLQETKDALAFIRGQLSTTGDPLLDATVSVQMGGVLSDAITEFLSQVATVAGEEGINRDAVLQVLPALRDQVVQTHRSRLKAIIENQPVQTGTPQTRSVRDAVRRWRFMLQQGRPKYEADAFLGRELARHTATSAEEDRMTNAAGVATELEQALKEELQENMAQTQTLRDIGQAP